MPLDAGSVFVRLFGDVDRSGFDHFEALVKEADGRTATATLGARIDDQPFTAFFARLAEAGRSRAEAQLGAVVNPGGFDQAKARTDEHGHRRSDATLGAQIHEASFLEAKARLAALDREAKRDRKVPIKADVDVASFARSRSEIDSLSEVQKRQTISSQHQSHAMEILQAAVAIGSTAVATFVTKAALIGPVINAGAGAMISLTGALGPALGLMATGPAVLGALGGALEVTKSAFHGVTAALQGNQAAYQKLDPAQRQFVDQLRSSGIATELLNIRIAAHRALLSQVTEAFQTLRPHIQIVRDYFVGLSQDVGHFTVNLSRMLVTAEGLNGLNSLVRQSREMFGALGDATVSLTHGLLIVISAAEPLTHWLAEMVKTGAAWLDKQAQIAEGNGHLNRLFQQTIETLTLLGHIVGDTIAAFFHMASAGHDAGTGLLRDLEALTYKWELWTQSIKGQNQLRQYFADSAEMVRVFGRFAGDLGTILLKLTYPTKEFRDLWDNLRTSVLPPLQTILESFIRENLPALMKLVGAVAGLIATFVPLDPLLKPVFAALTAIANALTLIVQTVPGMKEMLALIAGFSALMLGLKGIGSIFRLLFGGIGEAIAAQRELNRLSMLYQSQGLLATVKDVSLAHLRLAKSTKDAAEAQGAMNVASAKGTVEVGAVGAVAAKTGGAWETMALRAMFAGDAVAGVATKVPGVSAAAGFLGGRLAFVGAAFSSLAAPIAIAVGGMYVAHEATTKLTGAMQRHLDPAAKAPGVWRGFQAALDFFLGPAAKTGEGLIQMGKSVTELGHPTKAASDLWHGFVNVVGAFPQAAVGAVKDLLGMRDHFQELHPAIKLARDSFDRFGADTATALQEAGKLSDRYIGVIIANVNKLPPALQRSGADSMIQMTAGMEANKQLPAGSTQRLVDSIQQKTNTLPQYAEQRGVELTADMAAGIAQGAPNVGAKADGLRQGVTDRLNQLRSQGQQITQQTLTDIINGWASKAGVPPEIAGQIREGVVQQATTMHSQTAGEYSKMVDETIQKMKDNEGQPPDIADRIKTEVTQHANEMHVGTFDQYNQMVDQTVQKMIDNEHIPPDVANRIKDAVKGHTVDMAVNVVGQTAGMVNASGQNFATYEAGVGGGLNNIAINVNDALKTFAAPQIQFGFQPAPSPFAGNASIASIGSGSVILGGATGGIAGDDFGFLEHFVGGGLVGQWGQRGGDNVMALLGLGEAVINHHQQPYVHHALMNTYGFGLPDLFEREQRPHFMAEGGFAGDGIQRFDAGGMAAAIQSPDFLHPFKAPQMQPGGQPLTPGGQGGFDKATDAANKWWQDHMAQLMGGGDCGAALAFGLMVNGVGLDQLPCLMQTAMKESGCRNVMQGITDVNSGGNEARGILQVTPSTFAAYALPGMGDIWNPGMNAAAAVHYMLARYGHIQCGQADGYASGGMVDAYCGGGMVGGDCGGSCGQTPLSKFTTGGNAWVPGDARSVGPAVKQLQSVLGLKSTGVYDLASAQAVATVQKAHGMRPSGVVDPKLKKQIIDRELSAPPGELKKIRGFATGGFTGWGGSWPSTDAPESYSPTGIPLWDDIERWMKLSPGSHWYQLPNGQWIVSGTSSLFGDSDDPFYYMTGKQPRAGGAVGLPADLTGFGPDSHREKSSAGVVGSGFVGLVAGGARDASLRGTPIAAAPKTAGATSGFDYKGFGVLSVADITKRLGLSGSTTLDKLGRDDAVISQLGSEYGLLTKKIGLTGVTTQADFAAELFYQNLILQQMQGEYNLLQKAAGAGKDLTGTKPAGKDATAPTMSIKDVRAKALAAFTALRTQQLEISGLKGTAAQQTLNDLSKFNAARQALWQQFGSNFVSPFSLLGGMGATEPRYFGAGSSGMGSPLIQSQGGQGQPITIINNYAGAPNDAMTWAQQQAWEVRVAI